MAAAVAVALAPHGAAAAEEETCMPLCEFDADRTGSCQVSRRYAAGLMESFEAPPWNWIAAKLIECEELDAAGCANVPSCELDQWGRCSAARSWAIPMLAASSEEGGAGLGPDRCGALGHMLNASAECLVLADQATCEAASCVWDVSAASCGSSRESTLLVLRRDYKEQLARVGLRRMRCAAFGSPAACVGDCEWSPAEGRCLLRAIDALLSVVGSDCPLNMLLRRHAECGDVSTSDQTLCELGERSDGLPECAWRDGRCEAHPTALEFDLALYFGVQHPQVIPAIRTAQYRCRSFLLAEDCTAADLCAPGINNQTGGAARPRALAATLWATPAIAWATAQLHAGL